MQKMAASFEPMLENGSSADVVAKVVLNAVTSEKSHVFKNLGVLVMNTDVCIAWFVAPSYSKIQDVNC